MIEHLESEPAARAAVDRFARDARERRSWLRRSIAFKDQGDARMRRQIIRWLGREYHEATPSIVDTLRAALADPDWEVRASAMIVSARIRAQMLHAVVRTTTLPPSPNEHGLSDRDIRVLVAARIIASESLVSANPDDMDRAQVILRQLSDAPRHLVRSVLGLSVEQRDGAWLLLHALATPNELAEPLPDPLPAGLTLSDQRAWLAGVIELCWVSPQMHLLGGDHVQRQPSATTEVRAYTPASGFFIARRPLTAAAALQLGLGPFPSSPDRPRGAHPAGTPDAPLALTHDDARALCASISARIGAAVSLPTADELECAARGTDGRRFPWGNGLDKVDGQARSPHGIERFAGPLAQWTTSFDDRRIPLVLGGPQSPHCAGRSPSFEVNAVRPVVRVKQ